MPRPHLERLLQVRSIELQDLAIWLSYKVDLDTSQEDHFPPLSSPPDLVHPGLQIMGRTLSSRLYIDLIFNSSSKYAVWDPAYDRIAARIFLTPCHPM